MPRAGKLTPTERAQEKADAAEREMVEMRRRTTEAEAKTRDAEEAIEHLETELNVQDGNERGRDVLGEKQEHVRQLEVRVKELEGREAELLRENRGLRRLLKQCKQELAKVQQRWAEERGTSEDDGVAS